MSSQVIIGFLAIATLITNIGFLVLILLFAASKLNNIFKINWPHFEYLVRLNSIKIGFIISLTAMLGSLYFSELAGFEPCKLCWLQRIFMYPLSVIFGVAVCKKLKDAWNYVLPLSLSGLVIAVYHYYFQVTGSALIPCSTVGFSVSCSERFFTYYGYITIPWMSLSAFAYIFFLGLIGRKTN